MRKKKLLAIYSFLIALYLVHASAYGLEKSVIIGYNKQPGNSERAIVENKQGRVKHGFRHLNALAVDIDESELPGLLDNPDIAFIEEDVQISAIEPVVSNLPGMSLMATGGLEYDNAWSVSLIGAASAHNLSVTGAGVKVAILDTGIDYHHPDLDLNYSGGDNFISLDINNRDPMDDSFNSHGTHVAGIVAAELDGSGVVGVSPNASIYAVKVLDGAGFGSLSAIVSGIDWAISNQMDIVNMSMGISAYSQLLEDACQAAEAADILLVAAAGNSYAGPVLYPAAFPSVIAVGATTIFGDISPLSPIGPEVEIVAPGLNVYSTIGGGGYGYLGGTSQAAPHVTGLAALLLSAGMVEDRDGDGVVNNRDTRIMIQDSAIDLGVLGRDEIYGYGLVDVAGLFAVSVDNPVTHLVLEKLSRSPRDNAEKITMDDGIYDVTVINNSLRAIKILVYEQGRLRRDLSRKLEFRTSDDDEFEDDEDDYAQEYSFAIDASGTSFEVLFLPHGKKHTLADIYIQKQ